MEAASDVANLPGNYFNCCAKQCTESFEENCSKCDKCYCSFHLQNHYPCDRDDICGDDSPRHPNQSLSCSQRSNTSQVSSISQGPITSQSSSTSQDSSTKCSCIFFPIMHLLNPNCFIRHICTIKNILILT